MPRYVSSLVLSVTPANADAILSGRRAIEVRKVPPKRLPAKAYLAVTGTASVAGECILGEPVGKNSDGTVLPVVDAKVYRRARELKHFGMKKAPRSFRYVD